MEIVVWPRLSIGKNYGSGSASCSFLQDKRGRGTFFPIPAQRGTVRPSLKLLPAHIKALVRLIERADGCDVDYDLLDRIEALLIDRIRS